MSIPKPTDSITKIVLIGDSVVGKTCILKQFCDNDFDPDVPNTIGVDFRFQTIKIKGKTTQLQIWDTAGQEVFRSITHNYYRNADGVIVVYDITNENSFKCVEEWFDNLAEKAPQKAKRMLMGNKKDLAFKRVVNEKSGRKLANQYGALFFEVSAKSGENIFDAFQTLATEILKDHQVVEEKPQTVPVSTPKKKKTKKQNSQGCCG
ncbi:ras and ef-hand domain-containing protein [Anaeramoeba ignava]|uniref:Ras and ef-hand domain-containing protein n=1 Tax=Anaeramoeba ignava TaxID=1746090 RepID=A0A9Q0LDB3_ANAIG|nr:ras and ef-hand domain-containing protein [Anaeramoeba ignava]